MRDSRHPEYILLVDDNELWRGCIEEYLSEIGHLVIAAGNGLEAIEIIDRMDEQISLMITDLRMPVLDGMSLIRHVRQFDTELPIAVITGHAGEVELEQIDDLQVTWFSKPMGFNTLERYLNNLWPRS